MKSAWIGSGFSHQSVPSLSKTATRSDDGTPSAVTRSTKSSTACFGSPVVPGCERLGCAHCPAVNAASSFSTTLSIVKLAASCRGRNSLNVSRNCAATVVPANAM